MESIGLLQVSITVVHILLALFIIGLVIVQGGNSGGMGAAFGGGNTEGVFGATGGSNFMQKLTLIFTLFFLLTSMFLSVILTKEGNTGLLRDIESSSSTSTLPAVDPVLNVPAEAVPAEAIPAQPAPVDAQPSPSNTESQ